MKQINPPFGIVWPLVSPSFPERFYIWFLKNECTGTSSSPSFHLGELEVSGVTARCGEEVKRERRKSLVTRKVTIQRMEGWPNSPKPGTKGRFYHFEN